MELEPTRPSNYWCEQEGKFVFKCANSKQCWDCALIEGRMQEEYEEQAYKQYYKEQEYRGWFEREYGKH